MFGDIFFGRGREINLVFIYGFLGGIWMDIMGLVKFLDIYVKFCLCIFFWGERFWVVKNF